MDMIIDFPRGSRVDAHFGPFTVETDQPPEASAATPFSLFLASIGVFFVVQQIDIRFFAFLKTNLPTAGFALRAAVALVVSQFLDTVLFSIVGLYGIVESVVDIIILSFLVKLAVIFGLTTVVRWAKS